MNKTSLKLVFCDFVLMMSLLLLLMVLTFQCNIHLTEDCAKPESQPGTKYTDSHDHTFKAKGNQRGRTLGMVLSEWSTGQVLAWYLTDKTFSLKWIMKQNAITGYYELLVFPVLSRLLQYWTLWYCANNACHVML